MLRVCLGAVTDLGDDALEGDRAAVGHFRGERLLLHEVEEDAGVGGEAGDGDAEVVVYADYFLLVGGEFFGVSLGFGLDVTYVEGERWWEWLVRIVPSALLGQHVFC